MAVAVRGPRQEARQLLQGALVHIALEFDHHVQRHPVLVPAPRVEFRMVGQAQVDVVVARAHAQQEPDLLLSAVVAADFTLDEMVRHLVAQPVARAADDFHMLLPQSDFLLQLAVHRLLGVSPYLMPPCGNCHECSRTRFPHHTSFWAFSRMMPTLGRNPSRSSILHLNTFCDLASLLYFCPQIGLPAALSGCESGRRTIK